MTNELARIQRSPRIQAAKSFVQQSEAVIYQQLKILDRQLQATAVLELKFSDTNKREFMASCIRKMNKTKPEYGPEPTVNIPFVSIIGL